MADTIRLQVDILKKQLEELEDLQRLGGLRSKRELWDTAFTFLKWATRKKAQGFSIGSMSKEGLYTELETHFLEHYASSVQKDETSKANTEVKVPTKMGSATNVAVHRRKLTENISLARRKRA